MHGCGSASAGGRGPAYSAVSPDVVPTHVVPRVAPTHVAPAPVVPFSWSPLMWLLLVWQGRILGSECVSLSAGLSASPLKILCTPDGIRLQCFMKYFTEEMRVNWYHK